MKLTQHQKIVGLMASRRREQEWFYPYDFMPPRIGLGDDFCVGYEATARFAELGKRYPEMLESVADGKYKKRRICFETISQWLPNLPKDLQQMFARAGEVKTSTHVVYDEAAEMTDKDIDTVDDLMRKGESSFKPTIISEHTPAPVRITKMRAIYLPKTYTGSGLQQGQEYDIEVEQLATGKPIVMVKPIETQYLNLQAFSKSWKVIG